MMRAFRRGWTVLLGTGTAMLALEAPAWAQSNSTDESQDSGLGLEWVYLNADAGYGYANMTSFSSSSLGLANTEGTGFTWGVGAGVRLLFLSAGVRLRNELLDNPGSLWNIDLEAAFHMRIWRIDPYLGVRGGYDWVGSFNTGAISNAAMGSEPAVSINGFDVGPMLGLDIYFSSLVSIGAELNAQFLFLNRPKPPLPPGGEAAVMMIPDPRVQQLYNQSGSSVGFGGVGTIHLGIHF
ncbi:MAG: hypothetical protein ACRENE_14635 [Polyangiaceae bacterium]